MSSRETGLVVGLYRHFKGGFYFAVGVAGDAALNCENGSLVEMGIPLARLLGKFDGYVDVRGEYPRFIVDELKRGA